MYYYILIIDQLQQGSAINPNLGSNINAEFLLFYVVFWFSYSTTKMFKPHILAVKNTKVMSIVFSGYIFV